MARTSPDGGVLVSGASASGLNRGRAAPVRRRSTNLGGAVIPGTSSATGARTFSGGWDRAGVLVHTIDQLSYVLSARSAPALR